MKKHITAIIPARFASTRFPGKPLFMLGDKPMIQHTYERAKEAKLIDRIIVATDDQRIFDCVKNFGGEAVMTSPNHPSGTDRIAEAIKNIQTDLIINVQGDEPTIPAEIIDELIKLMLSDSTAEMGTVAVKIARDSKEFIDPNVVKMIINKANNALYFSRAAIPFLREGGAGTQPFKHWGIYAYTPSLINKFILWEESSLEKCEKLEQLRAMENNVIIKVLQTDKQSIGVDTPEDAEKVITYLKHKIQE